MASLNRGMEIGVPASGEELVVRHRAGDRAAFGEFIRLYTPAVFGLIYRFTGNRTEAEDLTQETFLRMWQALPRVKLDQPIKPYLLKIATNLCRDRAEKNRGVAFSDLDQADEQAWGGDESEEILERLSEAELAQKLSGAIDRLPPIYRAVITLRYTEELSYEQVAEVLELPLNTVRTHLRRAKARLRAALQEA